MFRTLCQFVHRLAVFESLNTAKARRCRPSVRLCIETLEDRLVPTTSPFFLDESNRLFAANDATGQTYTNTGAFAVQFSVGEVAGGGEFAVFRDGENRVYFFNGNNNVLTMTNIFAVDVVGGRGEAFIRDGNNQIYAVTLGAVLNGNGTFQVTPVLTAAFAIQMEVGYNTTTGTDFLAFRAGDNGVYNLQMVAGAPVYGFTGRFGIDIEPGNEKETFIRDGNNQVIVATIDTVAAAITFQTPISTSAFAISMSVGRGSPFGDDYMVYLAGDNSVNYIRYSPGAPSTVGFVSIPGAFAIQAIAGVNEIFTRDGSNRVIYYVQDPGGTTVVKTETNAFAIQIADTRWSTVALPIDQLAILDGNRRLLVSQNNGGGTAIASFFDTGFTVNEVKGLEMFP